MKNPVVVCAKRSPIGNFGGVFKDVSAVPTWCFIVLKAMLNETGLDPDDDEVIIATSAVLVRDKMSPDRSASMPGFPIRFLLTP